jgi:hypothetical protein
LSKLGDHDGKVFDLVITSTTDSYTPPSPTADYPDGFAKYNGVYGYFGYLVMRLNTKMDLKFQIVEEGTDTPMVLPKFFFSFLDMDTGSGGAAGEILVANGFVKYYVDDATELAIEDKGGDTQFSATVYGESTDNPNNPYIMTPQQRARAVTFRFEDTSEFTITYDLTPGGASQGREVYFSGISELLKKYCPGQFTQQRILLPSPPGLFD